MAESRHATRRRCYRCGAAPDRLPSVEAETIEQAWLDGYNGGVGEPYWDVDRSPRRRAAAYAADIVASLHEGTAPPEPPLTVYAVAFSNYEPAEVVAVHRSREGADADVAGRDGPYRVIAWEVH